MIQPTRNNVLIDPEKTPQLSKVIFIPETTSAKPPARGRVVAVGPRCTFVRAGDTVYFERFDWSQAPEGAIILGEGEILARDVRK